MNNVKDAIMKWRIERAIRRISKKLEEARQNPLQDDLEIFDLEGLFSDDKELDISVDDDTEDDYCDRSRLQSSKGCE